MGWFDRAVNRGIQDGVKQGVEKAMGAFFAPGGGFDDVFCKIMDEKLTPGAELTPVGFQWAMILHFRQCGERDLALCKEMAGRALTALLKDEGIKFGNPDYAWDRDAAVIVAREYETDHWEGIAA